MTNGEKFVTAQERAEAFAYHCTNCKFRNDCLNHKRGGGWKNVYVNSISCFAKWLDLEAEEAEKPLPCPFCGAKDIDRNIYDDYANVSCAKCGYRSGDYDELEEAIAAHNRVATAKDAEIARLKAALLKICTADKTAEGLREIAIDACNGKEAAQ